MRTTATKGKGVNFGGTYGVCYKCGGESPGLGLCTSCAEAREMSLKARSVPQRRTLWPTLLESDTSYMGVLGALTLVLVLLTWYVKPLFQEGPGYFAATEGYFVVSNQDKTTQIQYVLGGSAVVSGYVHSAEVHDGTVKEGGVTLFLHYLEPEAYRKFVTEF